MKPATTAITIKCPSCGNSLDGFDLRPGMQRLCPFCGKFFVADKTNTAPSTATMPDRIVPFSTDRKDFEREIIKCLNRQENIPPAIFNTLSFRYAEGIYFPAYIFNSGQGGHDPRPDSNSRTSSWLRKTHSPEGKNADFLLFSPAATGPDQIIEYGGRYLGNDSAGDDSRIFSYTFLKECMFIPASLDSHDAWMKYVSPQTRRLPGNGESHSDAPDIGKEYTGKLVFLPFWMATIEYGGYELRFLMDGTDCSSIKEIIPQGLKNNEPLLHMRQLNLTLQVSAWLSLILLFWNIWWPATILWGAWLLSSGAVLIYRGIMRRKSRSANKYP